MKKRIIIASFCALAFSSISFGRSEYNPGLPPVEVKEKGIENTSSNTSSEEKTSTRLELFLEKGSCADEAWAFGSAMAVLMNVPQDSVAAWEATDWYYNMCSGGGVDTSGEPDF